MQVALICSDEPANGYKQIEALPPGIRPARAGEKTKVEVLPVLLTTIQKMSSIRIFMPADLTTRAGKDTVMKALSEVQKRFPDGIPVLDPIEDLKITDESFTRLLKKIQVLESRLLSNPLHNSPRLEPLYNQYAEKVIKTDKIKALKKQIQQALSILQLDELKCRKRVLRRLQFINENEVVQLKARVACEISTGDELMLSELLFNGFFNELTPEQCAAVLSCFVFEEKANDDGHLREELAKPLREIQRQARIIAKVSQESKLPLNEDEYVQSFKPQLMNVIYDWAKGKSFAEICKMTDVYEGSLIRVFRRLEEALRQMAQAAKVMGSEELEKKFEDSLTKVKRDIVAAQSLYL